MQQGTVEANTGTEIDESTMFATYAMGGLTVGVQTSEFDEENGATDYRVNWFWYFLPSK